jgi:RNA polymerase sigma factor (sigma-70 family)
LDTLYRFLSPFLVRLLRRLRVPDQDQDDVAQNVRLAILREALQALPPHHPICRWLRGEADANHHLRSWVDTIALRVVIKYRTRGGRRHERLAADEFLHQVANGPSPARRVAEAEQGRILLDALDELNGSRRQVLILHYFEGRTTGQIARELAIAEGTVCSRLRLAREDMKEILQRKLGDSLHLMLGAEDLDPAVPVLSALLCDVDGKAPADPDSGLRDGAWLGLLAMFLLLARQGVAAPTVPERADPLTSDASPIPDVPAGPPWAHRVMLAVPLLLCSLFLRCNCQPDTARSLPRSEPHIVTSISAVRATVRADPEAQRSWPVQEEQLALAESMRDPAVKDILLDPIVPEISRPPWAFTGPGTTSIVEGPADMRTNALILPLLLVSADPVSCEPSAGGSDDSLPPTESGASSATTSGATGAGGGGSAAGTGSGGAGGSANLQATLLWGKAFAGPGIQKGLGVTVDADGNHLITGEMEWSVDLGGGPLASAGMQDVFVSKYDPSGAHLWSNRYGDARRQQGVSIAVDGARNILVAGVFEGTVDFGGGPLAATQDNLGYADIFIAKWDPSGGHLWSKRFGESKSQTARRIVTDSMGNVLVTGNFANQVDFGGGLLASAGQDDVFLVKLSPAGDHLWSRRFGGSGDDAGTGLSVDAADNVILTGRFAGTIDFGGGLLPSSGSNDIFVAKLNASGSHVWSKGIGGTGDDSGLGVTLDAIGNALVTGYFSGPVDFGGGPLANAGTQDGFVTKFDAAGAPLWTKPFGGSGYDRGIAVAADSAGNVLLTGSFAISLDFGIGPLDSMGASDIVVARLSPLGDPLWSAAFGDASYDIGFGIAVDAADNAVVTGQFIGSVDFGGGTVSTVDASEDVFLTKFTP